MSQNDRVLEYMKNNGSITTVEAFNHLGCSRLASRISDLRKRGIKIKSQFEASKNRYGNTVNYVRYSLERKKDGER